MLHGRVSHVCNTIILSLRYVSTSGPHLTKFVQLYCRLLEELGILMKEEIDARQELVKEGNCSGHILDTIYILKSFTQVYRQ